MGGLSMEMKVRNLIKKSLEKMMKKDMEVWPPECSGWLYQPCRPKSQLIKDTDPPQNR